MKKKSILLIILGIFALLIIAQIGLDLLPFSIYNSKLKTDYGTIVRRDEYGHEEWGLEVERGRIIKHKKILHFSDSLFELSGKEIIALPQEFKKEGLLVKTTYRIGEVIGSSSEWGTYIDIINIQAVK